MQRLKSEQLDIDWEELLEEFLDDLDLEVVGFHEPVNMAYNLPTANVVEGTLCVVKFPTPKIYVYSGGSWEEVVGSDGGNGGEPNPVDPELESRVASLENKTNTMVRSFTEDFTKQIKIDFEKTDVVIGTGYVRTDRISEFEDDFFNDNHIDPILSSNIEINSGGSYLTINDPSYDGIYTSKLIPTANVEYAKVDAIVENETEYLYSNFEGILDEIPSSGSLVHPLVVRDKIGRVWFSGFDHTNRVRRFVVKNTDGSTLFIASTPTMTQPMNDITSNYADYGTICVDYNNRIWVFQSAFRSGNIKDAWFCILNPDGSEFKPWTLFHTNNATGSIMVRMDSVVTPNNLIWVIAPNETGASSGRHIRLCIFDSLGNSYAAFNLITGSNVANYANPKIIFNEATNEVCVIYWNSGSFFLRRLDITGNLTTLHSFGAITYTQPLAFIYSESSGSLVVCSPRTATTVRFTVINPTNYTSTNYDRTLPFTINHNNPIDIREDINYIYLLLSSPSSQGECAIEVCFDKTTFEYISPHQNLPVVSTKALYCEDNSGIIGVIYSEDNDIKYGYNNEVPTSVEFYVSNTNGTNWEIAELGQIVNFPNVGNSLRIRAILKSPHVTIAPKILKIQLFVGSDEPSEDTSGTLISTTLPSVLPVSKVVLTANQVLNGGNIFWFVSNNGGGDYITASLGEEIVFNNSFGNDLRIKAVLFSPLTEEESPYIYSYNIISTSVVTASDLNAIQVNLIKTNFKVDSQINANRNHMYNLIIDVFSNDEGIDPISTATYDAVNKRFSNGTVISLVEEIPFIPQNILLSVEEYVNTGSIIYEVSRNDGVTWSSITPDIKLNISNQPNDNKLLVRATLDGDAELGAWAYAWS